MNQSRSHWIDNLRMLGIFLVVAGHSPLQEEARRWLRAFNMPLFLMVSGFLIPKGALNVGLKDFCVRRLLPFIRLYAYFSALGALVYLYVFRNEHPLPEMLRDRLHSIVYATGSTDSAADIYPIALWFFPCLIVARLIMYFVWKIRSVAVRALTFAVLGITGFCMKGVALPWEFESALVGAGFLALGHCVGIRQWDKKLAEPGPCYWVVAVLCLALGSAFALMNRDCFDIRSLTLGNPLFALPATCLLCAGVPMLAMRLPSSKIATTVASATILIFPVHLLVFPYVDRIAVKVGILVADASWYGWAKAFSVVVVLTLIHFLYTQARAKAPAVSVAILEDCRDLALYWREWTLGRVMPAGPLYAGIGPAVRPERHPAALSQAPQNAARWNPFTKNSAAGRLSRDGSLSGGRESAAANFFRSVSGFLQLQHGHPVCTGAGGPEGCRPHAPPGHSSPSGIHRQWRRETRDTSGLPPLHLRSHRQGSDQGQRRAVLRRGGGVHHQMPETANA